jgi:hypothetical protein
LFAIGGQVDGDEGAVGLGFVEGEQQLSLRVDGKGEGSAVVLADEPCDDLALGVLDSDFAGLILGVSLFVNVDQKMCLYDSDIMGKGVGVVDGFSIKFKTELFDQKGML